MDCELKDRFSASAIKTFVIIMKLSWCFQDYGIWERGDKLNHGMPELNASSIGMAKVIKFYIYFDM